MPPTDLNSLAADLQAKCDACEAIFAKAEQEGRSPTPEEDQQLSALEAARDELKTQVDAQQALRERRSRNRHVADFARAGRLPRLVQSPDLGDAAGRQVPAILVPHEPLRNFRGEDALDRAYLSGQFFLAALWHRPRAVAWCEKNGIPVEWSADPEHDEGLAMSGAKNIAGGYLVPTPLAQTIIDLRQEYGVFRRVGRVWPMSSDVENIPRRTGGLTAYFTGENVEITASDKSWDQVQLTARKLGVLCKYSSEISEDAVLNIADDLAGEIALAFAYKEDLCGFTGDGTSTYGGIKGLLNAVGAGSTSTCGAAGTQTSFGNITQASLEGAIGMLPEYPGIQPAWFFSKAGWAASIKRLVDAAGGNTSLDIVNGVQRREYMGYPVVISQVLNAVLTAQASTIVAYFGDLRMSSTVGSRREIRIDSSADRYFELDQLAIRGTQRFDIVNHDCGDASNAGAMIAIKTAAS